MPELPHERRKMIVESFEGGLTNKTELARQAGVSKPTVYKVLEEEGLYESPSAYDESGGVKYERDAYAPESVQAQPSVVAGVLAGFVAGFAACYLLLSNRPDPPPHRPKSLG